MAPVRRAADEDDADEDDHDNAPRKRSPLETIFVYIMKQSYAATLIIMMVKTRPNNF